MQTWKQFFFFFFNKQKNPDGKEQPVRLVLSFSWLFLYRETSSPSLSFTPSVSIFLCIFTENYAPKHQPHGQLHDQTVFFFFFYWSQRLLRHLSVPQTELISTIDGRHLTPLFCTPEDVQFFQGFSKQRWATRTRTPAAIGFLSVARHV